MILFSFNNGQLLFTNSNYTLCFNDIFEVKVGAVSGRDSIFQERRIWEYGLCQFYDCEGWANQRMIFNTLIPYLEQ